MNCFSVITTIFYTFNYFFSFFQLHSLKNRLRKWFDTKLFSAYENTKIYEYYPLDSGFRKYLSHVYELWLCLCNTYSVYVKLFLSSKKKKKSNNQQFYNKSILSAIQIVCYWGSKLPSLSSLCCLPKRHFTTF